MKSRNRNINKTNKTKFHFAWLIAVTVIVAIIGLVLLKTKPQLPRSITHAFSERAYNLLALSAEQFLLLLGIGLFLLRRWNKTGRKNRTTFVWGISFMLGSAVSFQSVLIALNVKFSDLTFAFIRLVHAVFLAGFYYGISLIMTNSKKLQIIPPIILLTVSASWLVYGALVLKNINTMMLVFLYFIIIPVTASIAYMFFWYGLKNKMSSFKLIGFGFGTMCFLFLFWPLTFDSTTMPPSPTPLWILFYHIFDFFTYLPIFIGFLLLPYQIERLKKQKS